MNCVERWSAETGRPFEFIYLSKSAPEVQCGRPCRLPIEDSLKESPNYRLIFENEAAAILKKLN